MLIYRVCFWKAKKVVAMKDNTFIRSIRLVLNLCFLWSSLAAVAGTIIVTIRLNGVVVNDYLLQRCLYYFVIVILYFVASKALLSID